MGIALGCVAHCMLKVLDHHIQQTSMCRVSVISIKVYHYIFLLPHSTNSIATHYGFNPVFIKCEITNGTKVISSLSQVPWFLDCSHCMILWTTYFHLFCFLRVLM